MAKQQAGQAGPLHVVVRQYDGVGPEPRILELARQHTMPLITDALGFRSDYLLRHEADQNRMSSVMPFASRKEAMRTHERVIALVREKLRDVVPNPPRVLAGQSIVLAFAAGPDHAPQTWRDKGRDEGPA